MGSWDAQGKPWRTVKREMNYEERCMANPKALKWKIEGQ